MIAAAEEIPAALSDHWEDVTTGDARRGRPPPLRGRRGAAGRARPADDAASRGLRRRGRATSDEQPTTDASAPRLPTSAARVIGEAEPQLEKDLRSRLPGRRHLRDPAARPSAPATTSTASTPGSWARLPPTEPAVLFAEAPLADGFVSPELRLAVIPFRRLVHRRRAAAPAPAGGRLASFADLRVGDFVVHEDHGDRPLRRLRDQDGRRGHPRLPRARVPRRGQGLRAHRAAREDHPLRRRAAATPRSSRRSARSAGTRSRRGRAARRASSPASCSTSTPSARRARPRVRARRRVAAASSSARSPTARRPTRSTRSRRSRPTWSPSGRWTG